MVSLEPIAFDFVVIILTATALGMLAKKTKQPLLIAYLLTGFVLGPVLLDLVTTTASIDLFSELGLGFLLFLLGIEMKIDDIRDILMPVTRIAIFQTILQTTLAFIVPYLLGFTMMETVIIALCTVFGATPVIVKVLSDKDEINNLPGKIDVGVLILQDIYLVIILALFGTGIVGDISQAGFTLGSIGQIGITLTRIFGLIAVISVVSILSSKYMLPHILNRVAENKKIIFIHSIMWAFAFISFAKYIGLSIEVGGFLAGLGLGQIPYNKEIRERIRTLTDFFLILFFATIGLQLDASNLFVYWREALIASGVLMVGNFIIMFYLIDREKFTPKTSFLGSINMTQVSEFSLVVGGIAVVRGYVGESILGYLSIMALLTMSLSTYLIYYNQQIYHKFEKFLEKFDSDDKSDVDTDYFNNHALIVGYNEMTEKIIPVIEDYFDQIVVVDRNHLNLKKLKEKNVKHIFGDFNHEKIRSSVAPNRASLIVSFSDDELVNTKIVETCREDAIVFLKSRDKKEEQQLYNMGATYIIREVVLAAEKVEEYLEDYLNDRDNFIKKTQIDKESLRWSGRVD